MKASLLIAIASTQLLTSGCAKSEPDRAILFFTQYPNHYIELTSAEIAEIKTIHRLPKTPPSSMMVDYGFNPESITIKLISNEASYSYSYECDSATINHKWKLPVSINKSLSEKVAKARKLDTPISSKNPCQP